MKITIITITYNAEKVLRPTLQSVFRQTHDDVEHWIIDGASKDETVHIAEEYKRHNDGTDNGHEVKILSEPDGGIYFAMNKGLQRATGDYILFLNAGDTLASNDTLDEVCASVGDGEERPAVIYGDTDIVDSEYHFVRHRRLSPPKHLTWHSFRWGMLVCHQAFYARCDIAKDIPYDTQFRHSADVDWCIKVLKEGKRRHLPNRRVHAVVANFLDGGDTIQNHKDSLKERFRVMCRHYGVVTTVVMHAWFVIRGFFKK